MSPGKIGGHRAPVLAPHRAWLSDRVQRRPETTLRTFQALLAERGVTVSHDPVWRFLRGCDFTFEKRRCSPTSAIART